MQGTQSRWRCVRAYLAACLPLYNNLLLERILAGAERSISCSNCLLRLLDRVERAQATKFLPCLALRLVVDSCLVLRARLGDALWQAAGAARLPLLDGITSSVAIGQRLT